MRGADPEALYHPDGDHFVPTELTQGPWDPGAQHGGAVSAFAVRCLEAVPTPVPMRLARLTVDLLRGVPLAPLAVEHRVVRTGKRVHLVELQLLRDGAALARAQGLFIRSEAVAGLAEFASPAPAATSTPDDGEPPRSDLPLPGYLRAMEIRTAGARRRGGWSTSLWCRLRVPVVAGEAPSPCMRLAAAADFASAIASPVDFAHYVAINPDLTLQIERPPESDWIAVEGETHVARDGMGNSSGAVFDLGGRVARVQASLFIDRRA